MQSFLKLVASGGYLNNSPVDLLVPSTQGIVPEIFEVFSDRGKIIPDLSSLKVAVHDGSEIGNAAVVFAHVDYLRLDARANLKKIVEKAIKDHVLTFLVGIELEVCFMKPDSLELAGPAKPGVGNYSTTYRSVIWPILNEVPSLSPRSASISSRSSRSSDLPSGRLRSRHCLRSRPLTPTYTLEKSSRTSHISTALLPRSTQYSTVRAVQMRTKKPRQLASISIYPPRRSVSRPIGIQTP